jgi:hypothetical protein
MLRPTVIKRLDSRTLDGNAKLKILPIGGESSGGLPPNFRIDALHLVCNLTLTNGSATEIAFTTETVRQALLDSVLSQVNLRSTALGTVIETMTAGELVTLIEAGTSDQIEISGLPPVGLRQAFSATEAVKIGIRIPFSPSRFDVLREALAPQAFQFNDNGIDLLCGDLSFADGASSPSTFTITGTLDVLAEGKELPGFRKVSPLRYRLKSSNETTNINFGPGAFLFLADLSETAATIAAASGAGLDVVIDGTVIQGQGDTSGVAQIAAYRGSLSDRNYDSKGMQNVPLGGDVTSVSGLDPAADGPLQRAPYPIVFTRSGAPLQDFAVASRDLMLRPSPSYPTTGGATRKFAGKLRGRSW